MKILLTGITSRHCNSGRLSLEYAQATKCLVDALRQGGHEVDHRGISWAEDLSGYDRIFCGFTKPNSFAPNVRHLVNASWIFTEFTDKVVLYYDDWAAMHAVQGCQTTVRTWDKRKAYWDGQLKTAMTADEADRMLKMAKLFGEGHVFKGAFIPAFPWADERVLCSRFPAARNFLWDPTPFSNVATPVVPSSPQSEKKRKWILASIQKHEDWLKKEKFGWEVECYGVRSLNQEIFPENEIRAIYEKNWGVLAPKYPVPGWWRARFYHSAIANCILFCDREEQRLMNGPYLVFKSEIERSSDAELAEYAAKQRSWMLGNVVSAPVTVNRINNFLGEI